MTTLHLGRWQDTLGDVVCDALIMDPPYSSRTHAGIEANDNDGADRARDIGYSHLSTDDVFEIVNSWHPRCRGWFCVMTSHDLVPAWEGALWAAGRYVFAPLACTQRGRNVRLAGDGPSNWTDWLIVARPKTKAFATWGALPGAYSAKPNRSGIVGGKPIELMTAIVGDYSKPGDLVCDPFSGLGTTAIACEALGRRFIGSEVDPDTHARALARIGAGVQREMFGG